MIKASQMISKVREQVGCGYIYAVIGEIYTLEIAEAKSEQYPEFGRAYYFGADAQKWLNKLVFDCSGLIKWARRELGGAYYDTNAQGIYNQCSPSQRGPISSMRFQPGVCVFMYSSDRGRIGHVGMYIGNGKVVEARGVKFGVVITEFAERAWEYWGALDWLEYDLAVESGGDAPGGDTGGSDEPDGKPLIKKGSTGIYVTELQTGLITLGYSLPNYGADGSYGDETVAAVRAFQTDVGIKVDGICGADTWNALDTELKNLVHSDGILTVTADSLNVREGPGTSYEIYTVVHKGNKLVCLNMGWLDSDTAQRTGSVRKPEVREHNRKPCNDYRRKRIRARRAGNGVCARQGGAQGRCV